jgi:hypothetical protein
MRPVMAGIPPFELALWGLLVVLEIVVVVLLLRRGRWRTYPGLTLYLIVNLMQGGFLFSSYASRGFTSTHSKYAAWLSQIPVLCMRAWALLDICRLLLSRYRGIWALAWRILAALGSVLVVGAVLTAGREKSQIISNLNSSLEWTTVILLVTLFIFARNYEVQAPPAIRIMALGFLLYSSFAILNAKVLSHWLGHYATAWIILGTLSFLASVCLWLAAVLRPLEEIQSVLLLPRDVYHTLTPELNLRLHNLNERLSRLRSLEGHRR